MQNQSQYPLSQTHSPAAAEVTTVIGDSVVDVQHLVAGQTPRPAWPFFVVSAVSALVVAICLVSALSTASANKSGLRAHLDAGKPHYEFRPESVGWAASLGAGLGTALAIAGAAMGIARRRRHQFLDSAAIEMADGRCVDVSCDERGVSATAAPELIVLDGSVAMTPSVAAESGLCFLEGDRVRPREGARLAYDNGVSRTLVASVAAPRQHALAAAGRPDGRTVLFALGSGLAHFALVALLWSVPRDNANLDADAMDDVAILTNVSASANEPPVEDIPEATSGSTAGAEGQPTMAPKGTSGDPKLANSGRVEIKRRDKNAEPNVSRQQAINRARRSGVLSMLPGGSDYFQGPFSDAMNSNGLSEADILGGFDGEGPGGGESSNLWGTRLSSSNHMGFDTVGFEGGRFSQGTCDPKKQKCGYGPGGDGDGPLRQRKAGKPPLPHIGTATVPPGADKSMIRRYIKRKLPVIGHCYERQLISTPELEGTVTVRFVINQMGKVLVATGSGMGHGALESCVAGAVKSIKFPRVGATINVKYPFNFRVSGR